MAELPERRRRSSSGPQYRRRRRTRWYRRRRTYFALGFLLVLIVMGVAGYLRYSGLVHDGLALRDSMNKLAAGLKTVGPDFDRTQLTTLEAELKDVETRLTPVRDEVGSDPLVALLRAAPKSGPQVRGLDHLLACATNLTLAGDHGLDLASQYIQIREKAGPDKSSQMADLVGLMDGGQGQVNQMVTALDAARSEALAIPGGLVGQLEDAKTLVLNELDRFRPDIDTYLRVQADLPDMLGMNGPRRYLVLAQDPAELRPSGGFTGTYGLVTFDKGKITSIAFQNTLTLDFTPGPPYVTPPLGLKNHLLGDKFSWQLADAGWSPDFPTSAQDALHLYARESGDSQIDGVIALDTYSIDLLLGVTGPITVPGYGVTISAGQTTMTVLANTRQPTDPSVDRKAILDVFGGQLLNSLMNTPTSKWPSLLKALTNAADQRHLMVWSKTAATEQFIAWAGWDGVVRQDSGDYLLAADANVAPTSKYNLVTHRTQDLTVQLDAAGNARDNLTLTWDNNADLPEASALRKLKYTGTNGLLGNYLRVLTVNGSTLKSVSGGSLNKVNGVEEISAEAGRTAVGLFLLEPPGQTSVSMAWVAPRVVSTDGKTATYQLTVQKEAGRIAEPLNVTINIPTGAKVTETSPGIVVADGVITFKTTTSTDTSLWVKYSLP